MRHNHNKLKKILSYFEKNLPEPKTELIYCTPFQLLCAVILSAQCTDKRVNIITKELFHKLGTPEKMANASVDEIKEIIKSCSYPNSKAKYLSEVSKMIVNKFGGNVPENRKELESLPGVGRKTANVVLSVLYGKNEIPVDTHVFRVSKRLGIAKNPKNTLDAEMQLRKFFPEDILSKAHHWLILHGRYTCKSRNPLCEKCGLIEICDYYINKNKNNKI